jgi:hypothetical protein
MRLTNLLVDRIADVPVAPKAAATAEQQIETGGALRTVVNAQNQRDHTGALPEFDTDRPRGMKQKEAKVLIVREWEQWLQSQSIDPASAGGRDTLKFYFELQDRKSELLDFQSRGRDKWQIVHAWLVREHHSFPY